MGGSDYSRGVNKFSGKLNFSMNDEASKDDCRRVGCGVDR